jgi:predicted MPP superfamily phosphohydrolase
MPKLSRRNFLKSLGVGALAGAGAASYAQDCSDWLSVERRELELPNWEANGFRVALLADLHMNDASEAARAQRAIRLAIEQKPDLLVLAGDFVNRSTDESLSHIKEVLGGLSGAAFPCLGVMGNHDYWCSHPNLVLSAIKNSPLTLLRNELFEHEGVSIAGVDDAFQKLQNYEFFPKHRVSKSCLAILHEPDYVEEMPGHVSLQLSGHTHGGQVCLPFGVAMHTPAGGRRYVAGFYPHANVPLYVTRGVGTSGVNYRLFCRPEVSILTLRSA